MSLQPWQRVSILAAANYLREVNAAGAGDARTTALHQGLLEVLDPARRIGRLQREMALAAKTAAASQERRRRVDRRGPADRRQADRGRAAGDRRAGGERRSGRNRRGGS